MISMRVKQKRIKEYIPKLEHRSRTLRLFSFTKTECDVNEFVNGFTRTGVMSVEFVFFHEGVYNNITKINI